MESGRRIEQALDRAVAYAEAPGAPPLLAEPCATPSSPAGTVSGPASAYRSPGPAATTTRPPPRPPPPRSSCCTAPPWSTTTCPVSTTPPCAARSRRSTSPTASRSRCSPAMPDRPGLRDPGPRRRTLSGQARPLVGLLGAPPARPAASRPGRPGNRRPISASATTSRPRPAPCSPPPPCWAPPPPDPIRSPGAASANAWARPIRSPTTCATSPAARRRSASPPAATPPSGAPTPPPCSATDGALDRLARLTRDAVAAIPACPGLAQLKAEIEAQARLFLPASLRAVAA